MPLGDSQTQATLRAGARFDVTDKKKCYSWSLAALDSRVVAIDAIVVVPCGIRRMKAAFIAKLLPVLVGACGILLAAQWTLSQPQIPPTALRIPGTDREGIAPTIVKAADLHGELVPGPARPVAPETIPGEWPCFRGPHLDNIVTTAEHFAWSKAG